ncbi:potassium channel family protein [Streptomyces sp. JJ36]|uniref:potassium channel family protein n=1 Tax=Streptomyces sp. JJ36 TaxID=2736645 RepID=UPI001F36F174|nr:potassium channel family protein [Streptomyces sp. JJ36]MCF6524557.1 two pore domain potassium channel family protein [Streptomyces sp. JJ36]
MLSSVALLWRRFRGSPWWRHVHLRAAVGAALAALLTVLGSAAAIVPLERDAPDATLTSFPRALWWAVETATTVGYGDIYPVTPGGRLLATLVMLVGITTFSLVTAALATWFVGRAARDLHRMGAVLRGIRREHSEELADQMRTLHARFDRLEQRMEDRRP